MQRTGTMSLKVCGEREAAGYPEQSQPHEFGRLLVYSLSKIDASIAGIACTVYSEIQAKRNVTRYWCERIASFTAVDLERLILQNFHLPFKLSHTKYFSLVFHFGAQTD